MSGRSARVIVTMGMPAFIYRWYFGAHGLKSLTQNLALVGIRPCRSILVGMIEWNGSVAYHRTQQPVPVRRITAFVAAFVAAANNDAQAQVYAKVLGQTDVTADRWEIPTLECPARTNPHSLDIADLRRIRRNGKKDDSRKTTH